jgi:hypothetical protein
MLAAAAEFCLFVVQAVLRKFREMVNRATEELGETKILMAVADLPVAELAELYGDNIGENVLGYLFSKKKRFCASVYTEYAKIQSRLRKNTESPSQTVRHSF